MTDVDWPEINKRLRAPWPEDLVRKATKAGNKQYAYIEARDLMAALDDIVGPENWSTHVEVADKDTCAVRCELTIHGVTKSDFGYPNNPVSKNANAEHLKEACTDGLKRAAVLWGPGREFYVDVTAHKWDDTSRELDELKGEAKAALTTVGEFLKKGAGAVLTIAAKESGITHTLDRLDEDDYKKIIVWCSKTLDISNQPLTDTIVMTHPSDNGELNEAEQATLQSALKPASELPLPDAQNEPKMGRYGDSLPPSTTDKPALVRLATASILKRAQNGKIVDGKELWPFGNGKIEDIEAMTKYLANIYNETSEKVADWSLETLQAIDMAERSKGMADRAAAGIAR